MIALIFQMEMITVIKKCGAGLQAYEIRVPRQVVVEEEEVAVEKPKLFPNDGGDVM